MKDLIPGGIARGKKDTDYPPEQMEKGEKVEMEHTDSPDQAREISRDHLEEKSNYYTALEAVENKGSITPETCRAIGGKVKRRKCVIRVKPKKKRMR